MPGWGRTTRGVGGVRVRGVHGATGLLRGRRWRGRHGGAPSGPGCGRPGPGRGRSAGLIRAGRGELAALQRTPTDSASDGARGGPTRQGLDTRRRKASSRTRNERRPVSRGSAPDVRPPLRPGPCSGSRSGTRPDRRRGNNVTPRRPGSHSGLDTRQSRSMAVAEGGGGMGDGDEADRHRQSLQPADTARAKSGSF